MRFKFKHIMINRLKMCLEKIDPKGKNKCTDKFKN